MNPVRKRIAALLLEELKEQNHRWFFVTYSHSDRRCAMAHFIKAAGPTDAWCKLHQLGWYPYDGIEYNTETSEMTEHLMERVPDSFRWRPVTPVELKTLRLHE